MIWLAVGISAATLTTLSFIPQVVKILKTKSASDISLATLLQLSFGVFLWALYGIHIKDAIIITANSVMLVTLLAAICLYFKYNKL
jgi:MtN3 and saliva related transmembrane protein